MAIEITFTAETLDDLKEQLLEYMWAFGMGAQLEREGAKLDHEAPSAGVEPFPRPARSKTGRKKTVNLFPVSSAPEQMADLADTGDEASPPAPVTLPTKVGSPANGASPGYPQPVDDNVDDQTGVFDRHEVAVPAPTPAPLEQEVLPPKELLALKEKVINELNAEYRKGRVEEVKDFLQIYGKGVKSFRQIDLNDFPAMDAAIRAGRLR